MSIIEIVPQVLNHPIFKDIDKNVISKYLSNDKLNIEIFKPASIIITPQTDDSRIIVVVSGTVEIRSSNPNHKVLLKTSGAGSIFGIANLYAVNQAFPSTISAKTETKIATITRDDFVSMLESEPKILNNFLTFLSNKVIYLNKKIASYTAGSNENKLAFFLLENEIDGFVSTAVSISDIAVMLDMGRASLYRAFDKLEAENVISREGRKIFIKDKEKLKKFI